MICDCGLLDIIVLRDLGILHVTLSSGMATVRPVDVTVRVEHLNCGKCQGVFLREPPAGFGLADCGCQDKTPVLAAEPNSFSALFLRSGSCSCEAMTWDDARDGALILAGPGDYQLWDRHDGAIVVVGGRCLQCGLLEVQAAQLSGRA